MRAPYLRIQLKQKCSSCDGTGECLVQTFDKSLKKGYKLESSSCLVCKGEKYIG